MWSKGPQAPSKAEQRGPALAVPMNVDDPWKGHYHQPLAGGKTRARDNHFLSRELARGHKNPNPNSSPPSLTLSPHNASK